MYISAIESEKMNTIKELMEKTVGINFMPNGWKPFLFNVEIASVTPETSHTIEHKTRRCLVAAPTLYEAKIWAIIDMISGRDQEFEDIKQVQEFLRKNHHSREGSQHFNDPYYHAWTIKDENTLISIGHPKELSLNEACLYLGDRAHGNFKKY